MPPPPRGGGASFASLNIVPENFEPRPDPRRVWIPSHWTCPPQPLQVSQPLVCCCIHSSDGHGSDSFGHVTCKRGGNWPRSKSWSLRAKEQYSTLRAKHRCDEFISTFRYSVLSSTNAGRGLRIPRARIGQSTLSRCYRDETTARGASLDPSPRLTCPLPRHGRHRDAHYCPALLQRALDRPEEREPKHDRAKREIEDDEQIGEMRGRRGHDLEHVQDRDGSVGNLPPLVSAAIRGGLAYQGQVLDKRASKLERIIPDEEIPQERQNDVLQSQPIALEQRPHAT